MAYQRRASASVNLASSLSLLAQPFLGGQAVLPQSHAGATIAQPQLQPFHCIMNTSRNKL